MLTEEKSTHEVAPSHPPFWNVPYRRNPYFTGRDEVLAVAGLATFYAEQNRDGEAGPLYQRALAMYERSVGTDHPETMKVRKNYTTLLSKKDGKG